MTLLLAFMTEGLVHRVCLSVVTCRPVEKYQEPRIVEMVPWCAMCACWVPVEELC
jgi:hypothetical protein